MTHDWTPVTQELRQWRRAGLTLQIWWRDDDAITQTSALDQLTRLSDDLNVPAHLAVIPKFADQTLVQVCKTQASLVPMVHGWTHTNHAPDNAKKAEFGHIRDGLVPDAAAGLKRMGHLFGDAFLHCFVPPWNRIDPALVSRLGPLGYTALSTFTPRPAREAAADVVQINTHLDPIHWRGGGGLVGVDQLLAQMVETLQNRRLAHTDITEPFGILTHHLVHDADIWRFTKECLSTLLDGDAKAVNLFDLKEKLP